MVLLTTALGLQRSQGLGPKVLSSTLLFFAKSRHKILNSQPKVIRSNDCFRSWNLGDQISKGRQVTCSNRKKLPFHSFSESGSKPHSYSVLETWLYRGFGREGLEAAAQLQLGLSESGTPGVSGLQLQGGVHANEGGPGSSTQVTSASFLAIFSSCWN